MVFIALSWAVLLIICKPVQPVHGSGIWMYFGQMETSKHDCNKQIPRTTQPTTDAYTLSTGSCRSNSHIFCSAFRNVLQYGLIATTNLCKSHDCQRALNTSTTTLCDEPLLLSASLIPNKEYISLPRENTPAVHINLCEFDTQVSCMGLICRSTCMQNARECPRAKERISLLSIYQQNLEATPHNEVIKHRI